MSFINRLVGVFTNPKQAFQSLAEKPVWVDALIVILILLAIFQTLIAPYSRNDRVQLMKDSVKLRERMGADKYNEMMEQLEKAPQSAVSVRDAVIVPLMVLLGFLFSSLILLIMGRFVSSQGSYVQILAAVVHAGFVDKLLGNFLRFFLISSRKSAMQVSTSLTFLFPKMEVTTVPFVVLGQLDFFQLWMFGILAFGLASIFKVNLKKALFISYGFWLLKSLIDIALGIIGLRYLR